MLKENNYKEHDIIIMRIIVGDEVIGKFISETDETLVLAKPLTLAMMQQGLGMTQYVIMGDMTKNFPINKSVIITHQLANKTAQDNYIKGTTGIQPASAVPNLKV